MFQVISRSDGKTIARHGQVLAHVTDSEARELRERLSDALAPVSTATTPAKARILRYPVTPRQA